MPAVSCIRELRFRNCTERANRTAFVCRQTRAIQRSYRQHHQNGHDPDHDAQLDERHARAVAPSWMFPTAPHRMLNFFA
jgi:hypothetical protein